MSAQTPAASRAAGDRSGTAVEENRRLRRTMRDLVALSTLPAVWGGLDRDEIARSLGDVLLSTLSLDAVLLRLRGTSRARVELLSTPPVDERFRTAAKAALASVLDVEGQEPPRTIPHFSSVGNLQLAVVRFGIGADQGALVACSERGDFPTERDRLLLGVGVNQMAIVLQRRQALDRVGDEREWLQVTLASIGDAVIATDIEGRITLLNRVAEELTGWTQQDAEGRPVEEVFRIVDERTRQPAENPVVRVRREGRVVGLANHTVLIARDGSEASIDDSAAPIRDRSGEMIGVVMVFRASTEQRRAEQHRNTRLAVTQVLNQSATVEVAATGVVRAVCENLGWDAGFVWMASGGGDRLECRAHWLAPALSLERFAAASYGRTFEREVGLPGRVWADGKTAWIPDLSKDSNYPRFAIAHSDGLRCAFACPVVIGDRTLGVVEFLGRRVREPDPDLLETMGSIVGNFGQLIERKAAEDELRRSEQELADFFENATIGMHWVGPDGRVLRVNRAELELLGYSRDEYVGRHIADFHADADVICDILDKLGGGQNLVEYPARLRCKDGSIRNVLIDSSVLWKNGRFVHTRCFTRDVTERRQAELALLDARSRLDAALEAGAIATWTWDIDRDLLVGDSKLHKLFNVPPADGDGTSLDRFVRAIHADDVPRVTTALERSVASGEAYQADYRIVQPDGSVRWVTARGQAERDAKGHAVRMPGVLVDITERKQLEQALLDADRRKDEFLATLAHELRNPLAPIRYALEILKMPRIDPSTLQQTSAMMERQVHHLARLVDDLLDVSRVMRGKIELRKEPIELAAVVARAVETVQPLVEVQRHRLELSLAPQSLRVEADPVRLAQVVGNLLTNAAKYTEPGGHIELSAGRGADGLVELRVRDNGMGIPADVLPHVFELFVQADHTSTKAQGGLGIGLTLTKSLVEMHGGTIEAHSGGLGKGCEFVVRLPLMAQQSEAIVAKADHHAPPDARPSGHRLMVVDDNRDAAVSLATLLRMQGHDVRVAHSGRAALAEAATYRPHLVFLDIGMPGMDGFEVARRMREVPGLERTVLAALTGWGQREDRRRTAEAGFDHHLVKPPEPDALERLLAALSDRPADRIALSSAPGR